MSKLCRRVPQINRIEEQMGWRRQATRLTRLGLKNTACQKLRPVYAWRIFLVVLCSVEIGFICRMETTKLETAKVMMHTISLCSHFCRKSSLFCPKYFLSYSFFLFLHFVVIFVYIVTCA
eukprot:CCRYP_011103-RA/>CCRYP_011103-RA protein AED:0.00 eAED:0.00 QI:103/1/1/1/0/0/2/46/119